MKVLVTGSNGFVGRSLVAVLKNPQAFDKSIELDADLIVLEYDIGVNEEQLARFCFETDFVVNLAGVNRPKEQEDFIKGNADFAALLLEKLKAANNRCPVLLASSTQAALDNPYGKSKRAGEELTFTYARETGASVYVYRFPNIFGKWCRPNYNSAVATFCHNIANDLPITVSDRNIILKLVYIDDVVAEIIAALKGQPHRDESGFCSVPVVHEASLGRITDSLYSFKESRENIVLPQLSDPFISKLYATYLSYLPPEDFKYPLKMNVDERGSFTEILRLGDFGQVSVNVSKPGITKGNHWHNTKNEKFCVVSGTGVIRFRKIGEDAVYEYPVSSEKIEVVDIPTGYTHNIINTGSGELVTIMWASETFNPQKPDTFYEEV